MLDHATFRDDRHIDIEDYLASLPVPREAMGGNGAPPLDEPGYRTIERIGQVVHGDLWHGKIAEHLGESDRIVRRWRAGDATPTPMAVARAKDYARHTALLLLAAAGEDELAEAVARRRADLSREASERGRALMAEQLARANLRKAKAAVKAAPQSPEEN